MSHGTEKINFKTGHINQAENFEKKNKLTFMK